MLLASQRVFGSDQTRIGLSWRKIKQNSTKQQLRNVADGFPFIFVNSKRNVIKHILFREQTTDKENSTNWNILAWIFKKKQKKKKKKHTHTQNNKQTNKKNKQKKTTNFQLKERKVNLTVIFVFHLGEAVSKLFIVHSRLLKTLLQHLYSFFVFCCRFCEHDQNETKESFGDHFVV